MEEEQLEEDVEGSTHRTSFCRPSKMKAFHVYEQNRVSWADFEQMNLLSGTQTDSYLRHPASSLNPPNLVASWYPRIRHLW
jgi:hypothetical protein